MLQLDQIISNAIKEDRKSQQQLYTYCFTNLSTAVALYSKDLSETEWVFNIGMLKVFKNLENYTKGTNFLGWARTILVRTAIDVYRQQKKQNQTLVPLDINESSDSAQEVNMALNALRTEDIIKLIQRLPDNERIIFTMFEIEGYSHMDIEKTIGIKKNTSKWLLSKARKTLKELIVNSPNLKDYLYGK